jgi:PAS domain S-box-containing protein
MIGMKNAPDFEAVFRASPYPYLLLDREMCIVAANPAYLQITGRSLAEIAGRYLFDAFPPNADDPESTNVADVRASIERVIRTRQADQTIFLRYSIRRADGGFEERYWSTVHSPVFGDDGEVAYVAQNSLDVTELYSYDRHSRTIAPEPGRAFEEHADVAGQARSHAAMQRAVNFERTYLRNLFNQAPGFVAVLSGPRHVFEMANEAYYQLVGHRSIIGMPVMEALPELAGQGFQQLLDGVYRDGKPFVGRGLHVFLQRAPGGPMVEAYVDVLYQPLFGQDGAVHGVFVQGHDVSEAHAAQLAKRESEERLAEGLLAARVAVWEWDVASGALVMSDSAAQIFGIQPTRLEDVHTNMPAEDRLRVIEAHARALAGSGSYAEVVRFTRPDNGRTIWIEVRGRVLPAAEGDPVTLRGVAIDVTERIQAEENLRDAHTRKDEFLAMLAHELRNPLAPIASAAQLLRHGTLDTGRRSEALDIVARQVRHMAELLDDLIDVSRLTRGLVAIERAPCALEAIVRDALDQVRPMAEARCQHIGSELPPQPVTIYADHKRMVQVLSNLLGNASKYTPSGGRILLEVAVRDSSVLLRVRDDGIGIPAELLPRVFDLFTQGERSADRNQGGLGVGLAVVRTLVEQHGGEVLAASDGPGKGSTFTVVLPLLHEQEQAAPAALPVPAEKASAGRHVLVVDDNEDAAQTLAMLLQAEGYQVAVETGSTEALARAAAEPPDVCLLDIGLPGLDGFQLARRLRAMPATAQTRLVAVTGYGRDSDRQLAREAGFDHHLVKPVDFDKLLGLLSGTSA